MKMEMEMEMSIMSSFWLQTFPSELIFILFISWEDCHDL